MIMKRLQFKCTLLTDIVLNSKASTEGPQSTLDFIPGNCFLGIVAKEYDKYDKNGQAIDLFHNGSVRFGDAHPCIEANGTLIRTLRAPASFYYPKLKSIFDECYVHHFYKRDKDHLGQDGKPQQLKQCRTNFYGFHNTEATIIKPPKNFSIKSAYDRYERKSKDEQMFGYQSLLKGMTFCFEVEVDKEILCESIRESLVGIKRIGRSRTAQYGLVNIESTDFQQPSTTQITTIIDKENYITIYCDGRVIFINKENNSHKLPCANDFGIQGEIDWEKSQIRTFQYAPWNFKRQTRDFDRYGIEKGSVFVIKTTKAPSHYPSYVGSFCNEGFGRVIFNPSFFCTSKGTNGLSSLLFKNDPTQKTNNIATTLAKVDTPLVRYLDNAKQKAEATDYIYKKVNEFVDTNFKIFRGQEFASQWGTIRSIAMRCNNGAQLKKELFDKQVNISRNASPDNPATSTNKKTAYLAHGVASKKWKLKRRLQVFEAFINEIQNYNDNLVIEATVNLSSEMAKIIKENGK